MQAHLLALTLKTSFVRKRVKAAESLILNSNFASFLSPLD
jgi:hypothetical protein